MIRLNRSRPNSSVPKACRSTAPGPLSTASANCADGLKGAMRGAPAAIMIMASAMTTPIPIGAYRRSARAMGRLGTSWNAPAAGSSELASRMMAIAAGSHFLSVGDPWVDDHVEHVDHEIDGDDDHGEDGDSALGQWVVTREDGVDEHLA